MNRKLVAYFSASGTTAKKAALLAEVAGADIYEIKPKTPYTEADVKWTNPLARCNREWLKKTKPELSDKNAAIDGYDVIYVAFPIWYYTAPLIINSFLESYDFSGKTIVLFATSGGSDMKKTVKSLSPSAPGAIIKTGIMMNGNISADALRAAAERY